MVLGTIGYMYNANLKKIGYHKIALDMYII